LRIPDDVCTTLSLNGMIISTDRRIDGRLARQAKGSPGKW
jgi:hypothetical protein